MSSTEPCSRNFGFTFYVTFVSMLAALFIVIGGSFLYCKSDLLEYMENDYAKIYDKVSVRHMQQNTLRAAEIAIHWAVTPRDIVDITNPPLTLAGPLEGRPL